MNLTTLPRGGVRLEYAALRLPLSLLDRGIIVRYLPEDAGLRVGFERILGTLDGIAGRVLADPSIIRRGEALAHRSEFLEKAVKLETAAQGRRAAAREELDTASAQARHSREQAQRRQRDEIAAAGDQEQADQRQAQQNAQARAEAAKEQADREAAGRVTEAERSKYAQHKRIDAHQAQATAVPEQQLADAADRHHSADDRRHEAHRLAQLADAERTSRDHQLDRGDRAGNR